MKKLVLYVFHIYNERVEYFLNNCIFYDKYIDFIVISNGNHLFEVPPYVTKIIRDNIGYDFGGWSEALLKNNLYENYDYFIFVNSSVIGPYLSSNNVNWTDIYINGLNKNNVKLFGSTINTCGNPIMAHVQSYIFSMDKNTLDYLIDCEIFSITNYAQTFNDAISQKEVLMSRKVIENGWNIGSLLKHYNGIDFTFTDNIPKEYFISDVMYDNYKNKLWSEYDLVFIKGNRISYTLPKDMPKVA